MGQSPDILHLLQSLTPEQASDVLGKAYNFCATDLVGEAYEYTPVSIEEFCLSDRYLNLADSIRPAVLQDLKDLFCDPNSFAFCPYTEAVFDEAIGSGKSYKTSIITNYYLHHLLCLKDPTSIGDVETGSPITIMNMSTNAVQARKVVFGEIQRRILNCRWFNQLGMRPRDDIRSELQFPKNITILPGHSRETYPLGFNLILGIMDEAAFYTETDSHDVAEEMFYALKRRINSRFGKNGLLVMISSPRHVDDFIERKSKEAEHDKNIFCRRRKIWEVIPSDIEAIQTGDFFTIGSEKIPTRYKMDFEKNPEKAWRDLGAMPSRALEPYFKQIELIRQCIDNTLIHPFESDGRLAPGFRGSPYTHYYAHVDLGLTHDSAGVAMGHVNGNLIVLDFMLRIRPPDGGEIELSSVVQLFRELRARNFNVDKITYDQFQSASSIQELNRLGFYAERKSCESIEVYETLKEEMYKGHLRFYEYEPFLEEIGKLELIKGTKVDHPPKGSKDVADAVAGTVHTIVQDSTLYSQIQVSIL